MTQLKTEYINVNMGPQHPATHGVLRLVLQTDGETVHECEPVIGYLHRSIEKIAEQGEWQDFIPFTDRVDYVCAMNANWAYCHAVEQAANFEIPRRAELLRIIMGELNRISSHCVGLGTGILDLGGYTPFIHLLREREFINDLFEELCGARLTHNYCTIGGVSFDASEVWLKRCRVFAEQFKKIIIQFEKFAMDNPIVQKRLANVGVVTKEMAFDYNLVGPNLRASGVAIDIRKQAPYSLYSEFEFDVPVGKGIVGTVGDCFDRFFVRVQEMKESVSLVLQACDKIEEGEIQSKEVKKRIKPQEGVYISRTEMPRGETTYLIQSDGTSKPYRVKIRTGSFTAASALPVAAKGMLIADVVALISSFDVVVPEIDR